MLTNCNETCLFWFRPRKVHNVQHIRTHVRICLFLTVAAPSMEPTNIPPRFRLKALLPLCNKNTIILCTYRGVMYHRALYLRDNDELIIEGGEAERKEIKRFVNDPRRNCICFTTWILGAQRSARIENASTRLHYANASLTW